MKENIQCPFCKSSFEIIVAGIQHKPFYGCEHKFEQVLEDAKQGTSNAYTKKWRCYKCLETRNIYD
jgi:hypothetical protein